MNADRQDPRDARDASPKPPAPRSRWLFAILYLFFGLLLVWGWQASFRSLGTETISYRDFKRDLAAHQVISATVGADEIRGRMRLPAGKSGGQPAVTGKAQETGKAEKAGGGPEAASGGPREVLFRTARVDDPHLMRELDAAGVDYRGVFPSVLREMLLTWALPIGVLVLAWYFLFRRMGNPGQAALSFGRSRARLAVDPDTGVTFADVAGCEEAKTELHEIVEFLREPDRFTRLGAVIPRGLLLTGPPGTGKTLLARAVAGEARVPFYSLSGSDFVEMFVGVGAARVRDLFLQAKQHAPCIVFIDELDAVGRARGVHVSNVNDEREHTLNQLLVEMDGFAPNSGVILLAATNRPDVLDPALLRPGRFDRQIVLDAPDLAGREAILRVHARDKQMAADVDLGAVARATPGFSGADLANAVNEAALLAARRRVGEVRQRDLEDAVERVVAGPERKGRRLDREERRRVAYHEVGHALVAVHSEHADPVHKISIVPRGRAALGYTLQLPLGDRYLLRREAMLDRIKGLLGGRAAEELVFGDASTGEESDLTQATSIARSLVCRFGMGKSVGLMHCARPAGSPYLGGEGALQCDCSEATARDIDDEVRGLLDKGYAAAKQILSGHRPELDRLADALLERETLDAGAFHRLLDPAVEPLAARGADGGDRPHAASGFASPGAPGARSSPIGTSSRIRRAPE